MNKMKYKLIVFDLDGTLIDSERLYTNAVYHSLNKYGYKITKKEARNLIGPKLQNQLEKLRVKHAGKVHEYAKKYVEARISSLRACSNVDIVKDLSNKYTLILLSNSSKNFVLKCLNRFKIKNYFKEIFYGEKFTTKDIALKAIIKKYKVKAKEVVFVDDILINRKAAQKVKVKSYLALDCSWDKAKLSGRERFVVRNLAELRRRLN